MKRLKLLSVAGIAAAVKNYIEKSDGAAIPSIVERQMNKVGDLATLHWLKCS